MANWIDIRETDWEPSAIGTGETAELFAVAAGELVLFALIRMNRAAGAGTNSDIEIGDGTDPDGYFATAAYDPEAATMHESLAARGAFMQGGRYYTEADTIDLVYAPDTTPGPVKPLVHVLIGVHSADWV